MYPLAGGVWGLAACPDCDLIQYGELRKQMLALVEKIPISVLRQTDRIYLRIPTSDIIGLQSAADI